MNPIDRILDAAANRCREGLRVVEDFSRFVLDDAHLCRLIKGVRHDLAASLETLPADRLLRSRDTPGDVGTSIDTAAEHERKSPCHVAQANAKRVEEALRTLEEYGKCLDPAFAARCEQLRYRFYTIEQAIAMTVSARERLADCRLYLLIGQRGATSPPALRSRQDAESLAIEPLIRAALEGGVDAVQLREKNLPDRELIGLARRIREWTAEAGALFIVNDRPDIAAIVHADGVHVGQEDLPVREVRRIVGPERLIGVSTHNMEQARQAVLDGADYLGVGPTFPSQTKEFCDLAGLDFIRLVAAEITLPGFAIGGINEENLDQVLAAGASRIAVSAAIAAAPDPAATARRLADHLAGSDRPQSH